MTLKDARQKAGLTQAELAQHLGVAQTLVHFWESGTQAPSAEYRKEMDTLFGDQVNWIAEFEPLDSVEQRVALKYACYVAEVVNPQVASMLIFNSTKYQLRQLLKQSGFLPNDNIPATAAEVMCGKEVSF